MKKSPLLAKIKFEPTFFQVLWRFAFSLPLQGEAGGRGVWGNSVHRANRSQIQFGYFQTDTASWKKKSLARPLRGLASRFSVQNQIFCLCSAKRNARSGLFRILIF